MKCEQCKHARTCKRLVEVMSFNDEHTSSVEVQRLVCTSLKKAEEQPTKAELEVLRALEDHTARLQRLEVLVDKLVAFSVFPIGDL